MTNTPTYLPILTTLLGGVLAISGGLVSGFFIQSYSDRREKNKIIREKGEEIYKLILILDHHTQFICNAIKDNEIESDPPEEVNLSLYQYKQLDMLVCLYYPKIKDSLEEFIEIKDNIFIKYGVCIYRKEKGKEYFSENLVKDIEELLEKYERKSKAFKEGLHGSFPI